MLNLMNCFVNTLAQTEATGPAPGGIPVMVYLLLVLFILLSLFMMLVILIQKPKGGGLAGAFGGAGSGSQQAVFGSKVGDVLTITTIVCFVVFLGLLLALNWMISDSPHADDALMEVTPATAGVGEAPAETEVPPAETPATDAVLPELTLPTAADAEPEVPAEVPTGEVATPETPSPSAP